MKKIISIAGLVPLLAACSPSSNIVTIQTPGGEVTCNLYWDNLDVLDQAISIPQGMSRDDADAYCLEEGRKQ